MLWGERPKQDCKWRDTVPGSQGISGCTRLKAYGGKTSRKGTESERAMTEVDGELGSGPNAPYSPLS